MSSAAEVSSVFPAAATEKNLSRRRFVGLAGVAAITGSTAGLPTQRAARPTTPGSTRPFGPPAKDARGGPDPTPAALGRPADERYWNTVQSAFNLDRSAIYLNAAGICPAPRSVLESVTADAEFTNRLPARHAWRVLEPRVEGAREALARRIGADSEELALTRGATEAMEIAQLGLDLRPGDEILTSDQDFFRMLNTWEQRVQRENVRLVTVPLPLSPSHPDEYVDAFRRRVTPRTRVLMLCHVTNLSGMALPVAEICRMAAARGVYTLVDGAQAFGHIPVNVGELGCDFYAGSVHKYALGPLGTGFLYVARRRILELWALTPGNPDLREDIRKFEDVGTHPAAAHNAVPEALRFTAGIGPERIEERIRALTARCASALRGLPDVRVFTPALARLSTGILTVGVRGMEDPRPLVRALWDQERIVVRAVRHPECTGVRVSPHIYNTPAEIDHFAAAFAALLQRRSEP